MDELDVIKAKIAMTVARYLFAVTIFAFWLFVLTQWPAWALPFVFLVVALSIFLSSLNPWAIVVLPACLTLNWQLLRWVAPFEMEWLPILAWINAATLTVGSLSATHIVQNTHDSWLRSLAKTMVGTGLVTVSMLLPNWVSDYLSNQWVVSPFGLPFSYPNEGVPIGLAIGLTCSVLYFSILKLAQAKRNQ